MHTTSGHWKLGLSLAFSTAILWGFLPIALKVLLLTMDANTVTWYRFLVASVCLSIYFLIRRRTIRIPVTNRSVIGLLGIAILGLTSNYIFYLKGLEYSTPNTTQVVIQLAPILLLLGGLLIFKERFNRWQWLGLLIFSSGIVLFFNQTITEIQSVSADYILGVLLVALAALTWAIYALAQKQLLVSIRSNHIMLCIYCAGGLIFLPFSEPLQALQQNQVGIILLAFCCINTLLAYGCFAEALNHLEATRVSAILAITPILTIAFSYFTSLWFPEIIELETLNNLSITGACMMVCGSMMSALSKNKTI